LDRSGKTQNLISNSINKAARLRDTRQFIREVDAMAAFFQSHPKTLAAGVVLLIVIVVFVGLTSDQFIMFEHAYWTFFVRWLHIMTGIMWMGLLWYLNFVQTRTVPKIEPAEHRAAITKYIQANVMFWFRYATLATGGLRASAG
jgi:uncharacterized membrane protein